MLLLCRLGRLVQRLRRAARPPTVRPRRPAALGVEPLETRQLLSAGALDVVFGGSGVVTTAFQLGTAQVNALAVQPDGQIIAAGQTAGSNLAFALARYNRDGSLDPAFGGAGQVVSAVYPVHDSAARGVLIQPDGKILAAGFAGPAGAQCFAVARYNPNGSLDAAFGTGGIVTTRFVGSDRGYALALLPNGQIIVAGTAQPDPTVSTSAFALVRYNANGTLDPSFGSGGLVTTSFGAFDAAINAVLVEPDGRLVAVGHTSTSSGGFGFALARYNADGSLDTTFGQGGTVTTTFGLLDDARGVALQPDGKLVVVGGCDIGGKEEVVLARYNADGSLDSSFGTGGTVTANLGGLNQVANAVALQTDGQLLVAGTYSPSGPSTFFVARYNANGTPDPSFGSDGVNLAGFGIPADAGANALALLADGTLVAGGEAGADFAVARYWGDSQPPGYALGSPQAVWLNQVYQSLLGRPVDQPGLAHWLSGLAQGVSPAGVVREIEASPEYHYQVVEQLYATLLGRAADPYGLNNFVGALNGGATIEQVETAILGSAEYYQRAGGTNAAFVAALYRDVLGRPVDASGAAVWGSDLANGSGRDAVALAVLTSVEAEQDRIAAWYSRFLNRPADASGLATWLGWLNQGLRDEDVTAEIVGSPEYFQDL